MDGYRSSQFIMEQIFDVFLDEDISPISFLLYTIYSFSNFTLEKSNIFSKYSIIMLDKLCNDAIYF